MAFVTVEDVPAPKPAAKAVGKPAYVPAAPQSAPVMDDLTAYSLFSPEAGNISSSTGPQGGTVNWTQGPDPNGYYWVNDGSAAGYWYRPEDGATWRATPETRAQDQQLARNALNGGSYTPTNAPTVYGAPPAGGWPKPYTAPTLADSFKPTIPSTPENMNAFDMAFSNAVSAAPQYTPADMAGLDLGFSNAMEYAQRTGQPASIGEGAIPQPRMGSVSPFALPEPVMQGPPTYDASNLPTQLEPGSFVGVREGPRGQEVVTYYRVSEDGKALELVPGQIEGDSLGTLAASGLSAALTLGGASLLTPLAALDPRVGSISEAAELPFLRDTLGEIPFVGEPLVESIKFATSPAGIATSALPFAGVTSLKGLAAANLAQDAAFGLAAVGAEKAGVPEPYAQLIGLAAAVGSEAAVGRIAERMAPKVAVNAAASAKAAATPPPRPRATVTPSEDGGGAINPIAAHVQASFKAQPQVQATNAAALVKLGQDLRPLDPRMEIATIVQKELSTRTKIKNLVATAFHKGTRSEPMDAIVRAVEEAKPRIQAVATTQAEQLMREINAAFRFGKNDLIMGLASAPKGITLQDLAARLPQHIDNLSDAQKAMMAKLSEWSMQQAESFRMAGKEFGQRADIMEGGFYLPRGKAGMDASDFDQPIRHINLGSPRGGFSELKGARLDSMADWIEKGYRYAPLKESLFHLSVSANTARLYTAIGDFAKTAVDEFGNPIAKIARLDPESAAVKNYRDSVKELAQIRGRLQTALRRAGVAVKQEDELDRAMGRFSEASPEGGASPVVSGITKVGSTARKGAETAAQRAEREAADKARRMMTGGGPVRVKTPATAKELQRAEVAAGQAKAYQRVVDAFEETIPDDYDRLRRLDSAIGNTAKRLEELAARGGRYKQEADRLRQELFNARDRVEQYRPAYNDALDKVRSGTLDWQVPEFGSFRGYHLAEAFASEFKEYFQSIGHPVGTATPIIHGADELTQLMRYMAATGDLSWTTIQGGALAAVNPVGFGKALTAMIRVWGSPKVYGAVLESAAKRADGMKHVIDILGQAPTPEYLAGRGMALFGGGGNEFMAPRGLLRAAGKIPGYERAERAFATASDVGRIQATLSHIEWRFKGAHAPKTREEAVKLIDEIIAGVNPVTGAASWQFGGDFGKFLFFAPRWMASQIEFVGKGLIGTPFYVLKIGTGGAVQLNSVGVDIAAKHLSHMIAAGVGMTVAANLMLGNETDFRPLKKQGDRWVFNPNFMRIRAGGDDYSIFGPWDSLARAAGTIGLAVRYGDPAMLSQVYRGRANPLVSLLWSGISGKDFLGKPTQRLDWFAEQMLPFSWRDAEFGELKDEIFFERDPGGALAAAGRIGGRVIGLKSYPLTPRERFDEDLAKHDELREFLYDKNGKLDWENLTPTGKDQARRMGLVPPWEKAGSLSQYQEDKAAAESKLKVNLDYAAKEFDAERMNVDDFKDEVEIAMRIYYDDMAAASAGFAEYKETGKLPRDPFRRAEAEYYALYDKHRLPNNTIDWNAFYADVAKLKKDWTPAQRKFFEEQVEPSLGSDREYPEAVQKYMDARSKVGDSGFYDAENKTQWLRDHPAEAKLIEEYRFSPYQTQLRAKEDELAARQAKADETLVEKLKKDEHDGAAGRAWREAYNANLKELRDWKEGAGSQLPDFTDDQRDPMLTAYFDFLDKHKYIDENGQEQTDWAAVDSYVSGTPGLQTRLDSYAGFELSSIAAIKREEQAKVEASGFFSIRGDSWNAFQSDTGITGYKDYYEWKNEHYTASSGWDSKDNEKLDEQFRINYLNAAEVAWIKADPSAAYYAVKWGYYTPSSKAEKAALGLPSGSSSSSSSSGSSSPKATATPKPRATISPEERSRYGR